ncbi:hypothetical protein BBK14_32975 [Parafrankia soli]|uniref:Uncharacterized protein n=1 Tax=Parafrankia soli TaxID=2599596 RepID=A0A1S1R0D7_9ACTN|nr:hypothetical protein BBK14_32975 [Parafrankia soli]
MLSRRCLRAVPADRSNRSMPTTVWSSPGRAQSSIRMGSSLRANPRGSATCAAFHSASPYTDDR